jgi:hypothetical protein
MEEQEEGEERPDLDASLTISPVGAAKGTAATTKTTTTAAVG